MQALKNGSRRSSDQSTASRRGRSTVTFQYPKAPLSKILLCSVSWKSRNVRQIVSISCFPSSQFFFPRFLRRGWNQALASINCTLPRRCRGFRLVRTHT